MSLHDLYDLFLYSEFVLFVFTDPVAPMGPGPRSDGSGGLGQTSVRASPASAPAPPLRLSAGPALQAAPAGDAPAASRGSIHEPFQGSNMVYIYILVARYTPAPPRHLCGFI